MDGQPLKCRKRMIRSTAEMVKGVREVLFSILFANFRDKRSEASMQFGLLHCLDWRNISACLSSIIAPLFPNLHTVVGVFKGVLGGIPL